MKLVGKTFAIADSGFTFEIEQDGAVSQKNVNISEETSAISLRDE